MNSYAYVMYEKENYPGSTGEAVCFADSVMEMAKRMKLSRTTIYSMIDDNDSDNIHNNVSHIFPIRQRYEIRKVYLS